MAYYVRGPDGKRVLKTTKKDGPKLEAKLAEIEARGKPTTAKLASKVADRRKFNGGRRTKKEKKPRPSAKIDLLSLSADKLTPELQKEFINAILHGLPQESAAWICGITPQTLRIWHAKAMDPEETDPKYGAFIMSVQKAESVLEAQIVAHAVALGGVFGKKGEPSFESQADARALLQMRFRKRWGNGAAVTADKETGELTAGVPQKPTLSETAEMTLEELKEISGAHMRILERAIKRKTGPREPLKEPAIGRKLGD